MQTSKEALALVPFYAPARTLLSVGISIVRWNSWGSSVCVDILRPLAVSHAHPRFDCEVFVPEVRFLDFCFTKIICVDL